MTHVALVQAMSTRRRNKTVFTLEAREGNTSMQIEDKNKQHEVDLEGRVLL